MTECYPNVRMQKLWEQGLRPALLPGTHMDNAWLAYQGSVRHG